MGGRSPLVVERTSHERQDRHARTGPCLPAWTAMSWRGSPKLTAVEEVAAGTTLTHEGRHEGYFNILVAGTVEVSRGGVVIDTGSGRSFFGEIALLDEDPGPPP